MQYISKTKSGLGEEGSKLKLSIEQEHNGPGKIIYVDIGKRSNKSFFSNPSKSIDHADLSYIKDRFPMISTEARAETFKRLYKNLFIEVSVEQLELMKHALGLAYSKKPYRNRFQTTEDDKDWSELVEKGLAIKGSFNCNEYTWFFLSHQGIEYVLGRSVSNKAYKEL